MKVLEAQPVPPLGWHAFWAGNTGEGKTVNAATLLLAVPDAIIINTKDDELFAQVGQTIVDKGDNKNIMKVTTGRWDWRPGRTWKRDVSAKNQFFEWVYRAGRRVIYTDEYRAVGSAKSWPIWFEDCFKEGRSRHLSFWGTTQELVGVPGFTWGQAQYKVLLYLGDPDDQKIAQRWFQNRIDWTLLPERSHRFLLKTPSGVFGPQPPVRTTLRLPKGV